MVSKSPHTSLPSDSSSKVMDAVRKFSSMSASSPFSSLQKSRFHPVESRYQHGQNLGQGRRRTHREDDRHDGNNQRDDVAEFEDIDPIEANKILTDHIDVLQHDCDTMSDILERVDHRLRAVERNSQALLDIVNNTNNNNDENSAGKHIATTTTTNVLLCRLEAVDAYISSLQDIIDTQHTELQQLKGKRVLKEDSERGDNSEMVSSTTESLDSSLSFQQLQNQYIRKIDMIAKLQDDNEIKDVQIQELQNQLDELSLQHSKGTKKNTDMATKRRIFRL